MLSYVYPAFDFCSLQSRTGPPLHISTPLSDVQLKLMRDPSDSGYHEVCVTMSDEFLKQSATHDSNDLSSVVQARSHAARLRIRTWAFSAPRSRQSVLPPF
eukprot:6183592-Pleurochrysis_carterae.AAC.3